jgi:hypothetical protein
LILIAQQYRQLFLIALGAAAGVLVQDVVDVLEGCSNVKTILVGSGGRRSGDKFIKARGKFGGFSEAAIERFGGNLLV